MKGVVIIDKLLLICMKIELIVLLLSIGTYLSKLLLKNLVFHWRLFSWLVN